MKTGNFSYSVVVRDIPNEGRRYSIEANADERRALADSLGIPEVLSLKADIEVRPVRGQAFSVRGSVAASVVQTDVVTLDPVTQQVSEEIDVTLMAADKAPRSRQAEILIDVEETDGPELYHNGRIDLGLIAAEHLALALDQYPRAPDTDFGGYVEDDPAANPSPFAVLAELKKGPN